MMRCALLACLFLAGCTSLNQRSDYYETQYRGAQALAGETQAFERLSALQQTWEARSSHGPVRDVFVCSTRQDRAATMADGTLRVVRARESILSQRELTEVIVNALADLESEYDALAGLLVDGEAAAAVLAAVSEQKYLARRMANSLVLMSQSDMNGAVEAADLFGRDVARFQYLLDATINGNDELGIDPPDNSEVEDSLSQIEELFTGYVADSTGDLLDNVAYRFDAWLALGEMAALGDGRRQKAKEKAEQTVPAAADDAAGSESDAPADEDVVEDAAADDAEASGSAAEMPEGSAGEDAVGSDIPDDDMADDGSAAAEDDGNMNDAGDEGDAGMDTEDEGVDGGSVEDAAAGDDDFTDEGE